MIRKIVTISVKIIITIIIINLEMIDQRINTSIIYVVIANGTKTICRGLVASLREFHNIL